MSLNAPISRWTADHVAAIGNAAAAEIDLISAADAAPILPGFDLWDMWPVQQRDGQIADIHDGTLWMVLSAPNIGDPGLRHFLARIRLLHQRGSVWHDLGNAMPDGFSPGNREWAGSAIIDGDQITLFWTAAGVAQAERGYQQRLFQSTGTLQSDATIAHWSTPVEAVASDGVHYQHADQNDGQPGMIKAFRDPGYFRDPASGDDYLLFTASLGGSKSNYCGAIGLAKGDGAGGWSLLPPIVHADGLCNELERAHAIHHAGLVYVFWSTQRGVFAPDGASAPTGLYGMVGPSIHGPFTPMNGTGLVLANPAREPSQTYSWCVLGNLDVISFIDHWGLHGRTLDDHPELNRSQFGGTPAPVIRIALDGDRSTMISTRAMAA